MSEKLFDLTLNVARNMYKYRIPVPIPIMAMPIVRGLSSSKIR